MMTERFDVSPLPGATFGGVVGAPGAPGARAVVAAAEERPEAPPDIVSPCQGLALLPGLHAIRIMWRTTVMGNPGPEYAGQRPSWIPEAV